MTQESYVDTSTAAQLDEADMSTATQLDGVAIQGYAVEQTTPAEQSVSLFDRFRNRGAIWMATGTMALGGAFAAKHASPDTASAGYSGESAALMTETSAENAETENAALLAFCAKAATAAAPIKTHYAFTSKKRKAVKMTATLPAYPAECDAVGERRVVLSASIRPYGSTSKRLSSGFTYMTRPGKAITTGSGETRVTDTQKLETGYGNRKNLIDPKTKEYRCQPQKRGKKSGKNSKNVQKVRDTRFTVSIEYLDQNGNRVPYNDGVTGKYPKRHHIERDINKKGYGC